MKKLSYLLIFILLASISNAQVGINSDNSVPDPSAMLDVKSESKGLLAPRIALVSLTLPDPVENPAAGLLVFNTATSGTTPGDVVPGYYCWTGVRWIPVLAPTGTNVGDMQYWNGMQWITIPIGQPGQFLQVSPENIPHWAGSAFATVITSEVTGITAISAITGGTVITDGGATITARGICLGTSPNPDFSDSVIYAGNGVGSYEISLTDLTPGTHYFLRAFAVNSVGTAFGMQVDFITPPPLELFAIVNNPVVCAGLTGSVDIDPSGGVPPYAYFWSNGQTTQDISELYAGEYSVTVTDANLYSISQSWLLTDPGEVSWTGVASPPDCHGSENGSISTMSTEGGTPPYLYEWSGPNGFSATTPNITGLQPGFYQLVVTDSLGCDVYGFQYLMEPEMLTIDPSASITPASCTGACTGAISGVFVSGGTEPYFYSWTTGDTLPDLVNLCAGTFSLTITDAHGCQANQSFTVDQEPLLPVSVTISASANPVNFGTSVTLTAVPVNGGDNPVYQWKINGTVIGSDTNVFIYNPVNQDTVTCTLTSDLQCSSGNPAISEPLVIGINPNTAPCPGVPTVDYGGQTYHTILIGNQCWFRENLNIGTRIDGTSSQTNNTLIEKYCYNNSEDSCTVYGGLYQWNEMMQYVTTPGTQGICPTGWHIPTDAEWSVLVNYLGGSAVAGKKLKESGTAHWQSPNLFADNLSGFSALGGGYRRADIGLFSSIMTGSHYYSSTDTNTTQVWKRFLSWDAGSIQRNANVKNNGFSVRCIKDCYTGCSFSCGQSLYVNHTAGAVAPVSKTTSYTTVTNLPGEPAKCWIASNLGSSHQAQWQTDNSESAAGWYWQFNKKKGYKHDGAILTPTWTITGIFENSNWTQTNDPCSIELGAPWRIPTYAEFNNLNNTGLWINWNEPWNSPLKLHAAGCLGYSAGSLYSRGSSGYYWTTEQSGNSNAWGYTAYNGGSLMNVYNKAYGFPLRCVRE